MIHKKIIFGLFIFSFLSACTSPTAMLGPAYTLSLQQEILLKLDFIMDQIN